MIKIITKKNAKIDNSNLCKFYLIVFIFAQILFSAMALAAEKSVKTLDIKKQIIAEDGGKWKHDPFAGALKKTTASSLAGSKGTSLPLGKMLSAKTVPATAPEEEFLLQGIMQVDGSYHALINGRVVKQGEMIAGVTVRTIKRYSVVVKTASKEIKEYDIYQGRIDRGKK